MVETVLHTWSGTCVHCVVSADRPLRGVAPVDEGSVEASKKDATSMAFCYNVGRLLLTTPLADIQDTSAYDAVFFAGGFGTVWDFPDNADIQRIVKEMWEDDKVVSGNGHGPLALVNVVLSDSTPLVEGRDVSAFTNAEEVFFQPKVKI